MFFFVVIHRKVEMALEEGHYLSGFHFISCFWWGGGEGKEVPGGRVYANLGLLCGLRLVIESRSLEEQVLKFFQHGLM